MLWETSLPVLLNVCYDKKHEFIWFRGGYLNGFRDIKPFTNWTGWGMPRNATGDFQSVLLNASYHNEHEYIWFRGGDLNSFCDIFDFKI